MSTKMFKPGDFCEAIYNTNKEHRYVFKVQSIGTEFDYDGNPIEVLYDGEWDYRNDEPNWYRVKDCNLWSPRENEWCWFWDTRDNIIIEQFHSMENDRFKTKNSVMGFKFCEPFFGDLPTPIYLRDF